MHSAVQYIISLLCLHQYPLLPAGDFFTTNFLIEVEVNLRPTVLVPGSHLCPMTRLLLSLWRLQVSWYVAPSLTRGWFCNLLVQLLLGISRAVTLGSKSSRTHDHRFLLVCLPFQITPGHRRAENTVPICFSTATLKGNRLDRIKNDILQLLCYGRYLETAAFYRDIT
jgi:hypothetical protein